jgi:hypothetical protein
LYLLE